MRLLQRAIRLYSILSLVVLLIGIPVFYFLLISVVTEEVDEQLLMDKSQVIGQLNANRNFEDSIPISSLSHNVIVEIESGINNKVYDSFFTIKRYDTVIDETVSLRRLKTNVIMNGKGHRLVLTTSMVDHNDLIQIVLIVQVILLGLLFGGLWLINKNVSSAYLMQKEFTENAAHELQTPLAVFLGKLELLMQTTPINDSQAQLMSDMADASQRMNKLNKALILLTRIENDQFVEREKVSVANVLNILINDYEEGIAQKDLKVEITRLVDLKIDTNRPLMEILIGNLLSNAIRHNIQNGFINITINDRELNIENSGKQRALNTMKLFQRFQKESSDHSSLGLGLEIIDKICTLNHFALRYHYHEEKHSFTINF